MTAVHLDAEQLLVDARAVTGIDAGDEAGAEALSVLVDLVNAES